MKTNKDHQDSLTTIRSRIDRLVHNANPISKSTLIFTDIVQSVCIFLSLVLCLSGLSWYGQHLYTSKSLLLPSLFDFSGIMWVWSPELIIPIIGLCGVFYLISRHKIVTPIVIRYSFVSFALTLLFKFTFFTPITQAITVSVPMQSYMTSSYHLSYRDSHVKKLLENGKYYGALTAISEKNGVQIIDIDHGGVVETFVNSKNVSLPEKNTLVTLTFENQGVAKIITGISQL